MEGIILIFKAALLLNFLVGVAFAWAYYNRLRVYKIKYSRIHAAAESAVLIILGAVVFILIEKKYRDKYFYWKKS